MSKLIYLLPPGMAGPLIEGWINWSETAWTRDLPRLGLTALVIVTTFATALLCRRLRARTSQGDGGLRDNLVPVLQLAMSFVLCLTGILMMMTILFPVFTPARAVMTLVLVAIAVGFVFKDLFDNLLAGLMILSRDRIAIGDYVACDGVAGRVEYITIRRTHIRRLDGQLAVVPNHDILGNAVTERSGQDSLRASIFCRIARSEDIDTARDVIQCSSRSVGMMHHDVRDVRVVPKNLGPDVIEFQITWWTGAQPMDVDISREKVRASVSLALVTAGIKAPEFTRGFESNEPASRHGARRREATR